jgi:hypothetical protein
MDFEDLPYLVRMHLAGAGGVQIELAPFSLVPGKQISKRHRDPLIRDRVMANDDVVGYRNP